MEPIPPATFPPPPLPPPPPIPPVIPPLPKKKSLAWLIILVVLLLLVSTGVLAYQYYQLKTQVANPAPSPSLAPSPTPTPSQDPTTDWQTYTNTAYGYSLKYPSKWRTEALAAGGQGKEATVDSRGLNIVETDSTKAYPDITIQGFDLEPSYLEEGTKTAITVNNIEMTKRGNKQETNFYTQTYTTKTPGGKYLEILFSYDPSAQTLPIFDQILSTFKFTN